MLGATNGDRRRNRTSFEGNHGDGCFEQRQQQPVADPILRQIASAEQTAEHGLLNRSWLLLGIEPDLPKEAAVSGRDLLLAQLQRLTTIEAARQQRQPLANAWVAARIAALAAKPIGAKAGELGCELVAHLSPILRARAAGNSAQRR